ncbi:uncharacterized protein LOC143243955 isoform X2 [Tachypleus tridentatus]|uniref:uncharacterized protein LOC143243955 isoform X2 n=1 Tax=Tachypleus tridentatus TaxID=6853 RepID=UPI003FD43817
MEVFKAIKTYAAPLKDGKKRADVLEFDKDDEIEILDKQDTIWWAAQRLKDGKPGFVPAKYMKFVERRVGKLLSNEEREKLQELRTINKKLENIQLPALSAEVTNQEKTVTTKDELFLAPTPSDGHHNFMAVLQRHRLWEVPAVAQVKTNRESHSQPLSELRRKNNHKRPDMIPEPDYSDSEGDKDRKAHPSHSRRARSTGGTHYNEEGLILPKKPPNPCLESSERQNLHRELLFNQRTGKNVLNQKTELQKVLAKFKDEQKKKAVEEEKQNKRTALEKKLEEQASKIKQYEDENEEKPQKKDDSEFLKVHAKVRSQMIS